MIGRRRLLAAGLASAGVAVVAPWWASAADDVEPGGLRPLRAQPWFINDAPDLPSCFRLARERGKRLVLLWMQRTCGGCRLLHEVNFRDPKVEAFVRGGFDVLQLDLWGRRTVTDFDGSTVDERGLALRLRVKGTPTFQVFSAAGAGDGPAEVVRVAGYQNPAAFLATFRYVQDEVYRHTSLTDYLRAAQLGAPAAPAA